LGEGGLPPFQHHIDSTNEQKKERKRVQGTPFPFSRGVPKISPHGATDKRKGKKGKKIGRKRKGKVP